MKQLPIKNILPIALLGIVMLINSRRVDAQAGNFIQFWGGPQYVGIENFNDYNAASFGQPGQPGQQSIVQTYRMGAGFDYIHNFNQNYGLQTGLYYSGVGQKYSGLVTDYYHPKDSASYPYTSHVYMDYIRIPFVLRFNSVVDDKDRINMSIFFGFQLGYLLDAKSYTSFQSPQAVYDTFNAQNPHFNVRQLYNSFDFGLTAGAQFNFKIRDWEYAHIGVRFDRSIPDIDNLNYVLPANAPIEYQYPVSTRKETSVTHNDFVAGYSSQYISLNVYVGMSFRVKTIIPPKHEIRDDDGNPGQ
jgi:hypothetical protein